MDATVPGADLATTQTELEAFLARRRSLVLGTLAEDGRVGLSVAPFILYAQGFAVFLSELAPHTAALRRTGQAEVLLLEDEAKTRQPFARARVSLACQVEMLDREDGQGRAVLAAMQEAFGEIIPLLCGLPDFHLFHLQPGEGRFIAGFGRAYLLQGLQVVGHIGR